MENQELKFTDKVLSKTFFWIPCWIKPNHITFLRLILLPFVLINLYFENYLLALILFLLAAFTDALDGAIARSRNQITDFGKLFDPLVDKILIISVLFILIFRFLSPTLFLTVLIMESILIIGALFMKLYYKKTVQAVTAGKLKMAFEVAATSLLIFYPVLGWFWLKKMAIYFLWIAIFFAAISISQKSV